MQKRMKAAMVATATLAALGSTAVVGVSTAGAAQAPSSAAVSASGESCTVTAYAPFIEDRRVSADMQVDCPEVVTLLLSWSVDTGPGTSDLITGNVHWDYVEDVPRITNWADEECEVRSEGPIGVRNVVSIKVHFLDGSYGEATAESPYSNLSCI